jgi:hypothetical protein
VLAAVAAVTLVAVTPDNQPAQPGQSTAVPSSAAPTSAPGSSAPNSAGPSASASSSAPSGQPAPFGYQALWPFSTPAEAQAWQQSYRSGGHSPWHLDADQTALSFTTGYLGFTYHGATAPALTVVAWTGGHYTGVERFAITGVRT